MKFNFSIVLLISFWFVGCAPSQMSISEKDLPTVNTIGLYIIGSTQIVDNLDSLNRDFTIKTGGEAISNLLMEKGYKVKPLNQLLRVESVFDKYIGAWHIDEDTVAAVARKNDCESFLIIYYAYGGHGKTLDDGLEVYVSCSLYGWLGHSKDADIFASSHTALNSYYRYRDVMHTKHPDMRERDIYEHFLSDIASRMFEKIPINPSR